MQGINMINTITPISFIPENKIEKYYHPNLEVSKFANAWDEPDDLVNIFTHPSILKSRLISPIDLKKKGPSYSHTSTAFEFLRSDNGKFYEKCNKEDTAINKEAYYTLQQNKERSIGVANYFDPAADTLVFYIGCLGSDSCQEIIKKLSSYYQRFTTVPVRAVGSVASDLAPREKGLGRFLNEFSASLTLAPNEYVKTGLMVAQIALVYYTVSMAIDRCVNLYPAKEVQIFAPVIKFSVVAAAFASLLFCSAGEAV